MLRVFTIRPKTPYLGGKTGSIEKNLVFFELLLAFNQNRWFSLSMMKNTQAIEYLTFKANQYLRLTGEDMTPEQAEIWIGSEILSGSELIKGWVREYLATQSK